MVDQTTRFDADMPVLAIHQQWRAQRVCACFDDLKTIVFLWADDAGHTAFDDAGLFACNRAQRIAKVLLVVDRDRGDYGHQGTVNHIGRVQTPAKADLKQGVIRRCTGKRQQRCRRRNFKIGDIAAVIGRIAFIQNSRQRILCNQRSGQTNAFMEPRQMRAGVGVNRLAHRL